MPTTLEKEEIWMNRSCEEINRDRYETSSVNA